MAIDEFDVVNKLGEGSYATVFKCRLPRKSGKFSLKSKEKVAIKKINKARTNAKYLDYEIEANKRLSHPNIARTYTKFEDKENLYLVQEYIKKSSNFFDYLEKRGFVATEEKKAKKILRQLVDALTYARSNGISHRDIKLENILYCEETDTVKIIDWGLCSVDKIYEDSQFVGSPDYVAPEVLLHQQYLPELADTWSLGVVLFIMLTGRIPFHRKLRADLQSIEDHPKLVLPVGMKMSDEAFDLVSSMLTSDPANRASLRTIARQIGRAHV